MKFTSLKFYGFCGLDLVDSVVTASTIGIQWLWLCVICTALLLYCQRAIRLSISCEIVVLIFVFYHKGFSVIIFASAELAEIVREPFPFHISFLGFRDIVSGKPRNSILEISVGSQESSVSAKSGKKIRNTDTGSTNSRFNLLLECLAYAIAICLNNSGGDCDYYRLAIADFV